MQIVLDRCTSRVYSYQKAVWGQHSGKVWSAVRGGCSRNECNPDTVFGMVLSSEAVYAESGVYMPFRVYGRCEQRWLNTSDAILPDFEQHTVFAEGAVWLWLVLGTCDKEYLVPKAELFHLLPLDQQVMAWNQPWRTTAATMCETLAAAIARDEYAREVGVVC